MKAKILSMMLAICMLVSLVAVFPASAETVYTVAAEGTTVINHLAYSNAYDPTSGSTLNVDGTASMVIRIGGFVEYDLDVESAGYYNLLITSEALNINLQTWDASVDGTKQCTFSTWYGNYSDVVGDVYLPAGKHTLKLEPKTGHGWKYLLGVSLIRKELQTKSDWTVGIHYDSTDGRHEADKLILDGGDYVEYKVNVKEAGNYLMSLQHYYNPAKFTSTVSVNGGEAVNCLLLDTPTSPKRLSPAQVISLNAGENVIRYTNTSTGAMSIWQVILEKADTKHYTVFAEDYDENGVTGSTRLEGGNLVIGSGATASYTMDIEESGYYKLSVFSGSSANTVAEYSASVDGIFKVSKGVIFHDAWNCNTKYELGTFHIEAGTRKITIGTSAKTSGHYFRRVYLEKCDVSKEITSVGAVDIEDEIINEVDATSYKGDTLSVSAKGNVILTPLKKIVYKVNILRDGVYKIGLKYGAQHARTILNFKVDGVSAISARMQDGSEDIIHSEIFGEVALTKGVHEIELENSAICGAVAAEIYLDKLILERKDGQYPAFYLWAGNFASVVDSPDTSGTTVVEAGSISFKGGDTVTYNVVAPIEGYYRLSFVLGNGSDTSYEILVNDDELNLGSEILYARNTGGINKHVHQQICDVYLNEGMNTLAITNKSGAHYLNRIILDSLGTDSAPSMLKMAMNCSDFYDAHPKADQAPDKPGHDGSWYITFEGNDTLTYPLEIWEDGYYNVKLIGSRDNANPIAVTAAIDGDTANIAGSFVGSGSYYTVTESSLGTVYLTSDASTIKFTHKGNQWFYLFAIVVEPVTEIPEVTTISGKTSETNLHVMLGEQAGGEMMVAGAKNAIRIFGEEEVSYNYDVLEAGKYNVYLTTSKDHMIADPVMVTVSDGTTTSNVAISNLHKVVYPKVKAGTFDIAEGEFALTIAAAQDIAICDVIFEKVNDIEVDLLTTIEGTEYVINNIGEGSYDLKATFGGAELGKSFICTFAVYETDSNGTKKLFKVDSSTATATEEGLTLAINDIEFAEGKTYSAKVFTWNADSYFGESFEF